jgi:ankyrin repeat protein
MLIEIIDDKGKYPLHVACNHRFPCRDDPVYRKLIDAFPMTIKHVNHNGDFPLHLACCRTHFYMIIEKLITLYLDAVQKQNNDGQYPLDLACHHSYYGQKFYMNPFHINDCNNPMLHPHCVIVKLINRH